MQGSDGCKERSYAICDIPSGHSCCGGFGEPKLGILIVLGVEVMGTWGGRGVGGCGGATSAGDARRRSSEPGVQGGVS